MENKEFNEKLELGNQELIPLTEWNNYFTYPKLGTLRALVLHADKNGFNKVIRKINRRVLIKVSAYYDWVDECNGITPSHNKPGESK